MPTTTDPFGALRDQIKGDRKKLRGAAAKIADKARAENRDLSLQEEIALETSMADVDVLNTRLRALPKVKRSKVPASAKKATYGPDSPFDALWDAVCQMSPTPIAGTDPVAIRNRQAAAERENRTALRARADVQASARRRAGIRSLHADGQPVETRAPVSDGLDGWRQSQSRDIASNVVGSGGAFVPAQSWMLDEFAGIARPASVVASLCDAKPLDRHTVEVLIPTASQWTDAGDVQQVENIGPTTVQAATSFLSSPVETLVEVVQVSQQLLDRGAQGFTSAVIADAGVAFASQLDNLVFASGLSGNPEGDILGIIPAAANTVTYNTTSPTTTGLATAIAQASSLVGAGRLRPATAIIGHTRRVPWMLGHEAPDNETNQRAGTGQLIVTDTDPLGPVAGLPLYQSGSPTLLASDGTDVLLVGRPRDVLVMASDVMVNVMVEGLASQLEVQIVFHSYVAAIVKYASAWCVVNEVAAPTWL